MLQLSLLTFAVAVTPSLGSTVAIPMAIAMGLPPVLATVLGWAGATCKVPVAIWLAGTFRTAARRFDWIDRKLQRMEAGVAARMRLFRRWGWPALVVCSAIPAPGFSIWTAALAARLLGFSYPSTALALTLGLVVACIAVTLASIGLLLPILNRLLAWL